MRKFFRIRLEKDLAYKIKQERIYYNDSYQTIIERMYKHWVQSKKIAKNRKSDWWLE